MKRCVKKRLAMFLATATLVTSTGLASGLTVLAETVTANAEVSVKSTLRVASPSDDVADDVASPPDSGKDDNTDDNNQGGNTGDNNQGGSTGELKPDTEKGESEGTVFASAKDAGVKNAVAGNGIQNLKVDVSDLISASTKDELITLLKQELSSIIRDALKDINIDTVDQTTFKQFEIDGTGTGEVKLEFDANYKNSFKGRKPVVLHKHNGSWTRLNDAKWTGNVLSFTMNGFSPVIIFAADDATPATPSRGDSSSRGSNSSSGGGSSTTVSSSNVGSSTLVGSWKRDANGWWFQTTGGGYAKNRWGLVNGKWYFFGDDGYMKTGWVLYSGAWYYCNPNANNGTEGEMMTGWISDNGTWYYLGRTGMMETGWVQVNGVWYYLNSGSGAMAANTWIGNYYVGADGAWQQNATR